MDGGRRMDMWIDGWMDDGSGKKDGCVDGWIYGWMDDGRGKKDGCVDRWMDR